LTRRLSNEDIAMAGSHEDEGERSPTGAPDLAMGLGKDLLRALDAYLATRPPPRPSRSEMVRRILEDRLIHEGHLEPRQGLGVDDPTQGEDGMRPDELNATNDD
jgi:hypothetical protein